MAKQTKSQTDEIQATEKRLAEAQQTTARLTARRAELEDALNPPSRAALELPQLQAEQDALGSEPRDPEEAKAWRRAWRAFDQRIQMLRGTPPERRTPRDELAADAAAILAGDGLAERKTIDREALTRELRATVEAIEQARRAETEAQGGLYRVKAAAALPKFHALLAKLGDMERALGQATEAVYSFRDDAGIPPDYLTLPFALASSRLVGSTRTTHRLNELARLGIRPLD